MKDPHCARHVWLLFLMSVGTMPNPDLTGLIESDRRPATISLPVQPIRRHKHRRAHGAACARRHRGTGWAGTDIGPGEDRMKFGIATNFTWMGPPVTRLAQAIESLGFESMWMGEHPVIPVSAANAERYGVPLPANYRHMPDPFVSLTAAACATTHLRFGTNVCVVTQHNPINLAKTIATLDRISGGRFIFAYGTGWIEDEAAVFGYRFDKRLGRALDFVRAMKALWTQEEASYQGEHIAFPPVHCNPKCLQQPHVPVLVGSGNDKTDNEKILRRVARTADGWLPSFLTPAQMREQLGQLRGYCAEEGRDFDALDISLIVPAISFGVGPLPPWGAKAYDDLKPVDAAELVAEYAAAGVKRILVGLDDMVDDSAFDRLEEAARGFGLV
jgi:probable F420-dependent oxidoreductase